ncbi:uncharacterized protein LOC143600713 [Bidens hawaiensis]|uniref:uncharacterized protein LOC143600713 n=1 Tax=Bidens hawaiensis TaxID=980011 RepID=UPI00404B8ACE
MDQLLTERELMIQQLKHSLVVAQNRMKQIADRNRTEREFKEGDFVFLKLHPYKRQSVRPTKQSKLSPKYYGPFLIMEKIGKVAYRLDLPVESQIHPTFHVSLLKLARGDHSKIMPLPTQPRFQYYPAVVIEKRIIKKRNRVGVRVLIKWEGLPLAEASWEDLEEMQLRFPEFSF